VPGLVKKPRRVIPEVTPPPKEEVVLKRGIVT